MEGGERPSKFNKTVRAAMAGAAFLGAGAVGETPINQASGIPAAEAAELSPFGLMAERLKTIGEHTDRDLKRIEELRNKGEHSDTQHLRDNTLAASPEIIAMIESLREDMLGKDPKDPKTGNIWSRYGFKLKGGQMSDFYANNGLGGNEREGGELTDERKKFEYLIKNIDEELATGETVEFFSYHSKHKRNA